MTAGIYQIFNLIKGKSYVGQAQNISQRFVTHTWHLNCKKHANTHLQRSWNKRGAKNFKFNVLEEVDVIIPESLENYQSRLTAREEVWIDEFRPDVYNQRIAANSNVGMKHSDETKAQISAALTGRTQTAEHRANNAEANTGKKLGPQTAEHIANRAAARRHHTDDFIRNLFAEKEAGLKPKQIAEKYGLNYKTVGDILSGHRYAHIYRQVHGLEST